MAVITNAGGGGGLDPDELTAEVGDFLKGKIGGVKGNDEPAVGTLELTGDAADSHVLAGKSYYNTDAKQKRTGSMPNNGSQNAALNCGQSKVIPAGHTTGGTVTANSLASQTGGTATASHVLSGQTAWVNGNKVTGTKPDRGAWTANVGMNGSVAVPEGSHNGGGKVNGPAIADHGAWGANIGVNGRVTIPQGYHNGGGSVGQSIAVQNADVSGADRAYATGISCWAGTVNLGVRNGHYLNGVNWIQRDIPEFQPHNIKKGINIGGVVGTYVYADVIGYLYQAPNEMTGVTGGFITRTWGNGSPVEVTFSKRSNCLYISTNMNSSSTHSIYGAFVTTLPINMTSIRNLSIFYSLSGNYYSGEFGICTDINNIFGSRAAYLNIKKYGPEESPLLDVSMVNGSYYVYVYVYGYYGSSSGTKNMQVEVYNIKYNTMA